MSWRSDLRHLLGKVPKNTLINWYINIIEVLGDNEEESAGMARDVAVKIQTHRYLKGELKNLDDFDDDFRKQVEAEAEKLRLSVV